MELILGNKHCKEGRTTIHFKAVNKTEVLSEFALDFHFKDILAIKYNSKISMCIRTHRETKGRTQSNNRPTDLSHCSRQKCCSSLFPISLFVTFTSSLNYTASKQVKQGTNKTTTTIDFLY